LGEDEAAEVAERSASHVAILYQASDAWLGPARDRTVWYISYFTLFACHHLFSNSMAQTILDCSSTNA